APVAGHDGRHLLLTTPRRDGTARLALAPPAAGTDASGPLLGVPVPREYRGVDATPARLAGVPLPAEVDLRGGRFLRFAVDDGPPVQVDLVGEADPAAVPRAALSAAVNAAVARPVAVIEGDRLVLTSPTTGSAARIEVSRAVAGDARPVLFAGSPAEVRG